MVRWYKFLDKILVNELRTSFGHHRHQQNDRSCSGQQQVPLLECLGIGQMVNSMRCSIPNHRLDATNWCSTPSNAWLTPKKLQDRLPCSGHCSRRSYGVAEQDCRESHRQPLQPPHCNGEGRGVHSVRRSSVEQRSFAHTVWPLGAVPVPLSDVGRQTKGTQTTHTIRAQSH